jgi:hypothetical protein
MKNQLILLFSALILLGTGCKKKSFDPTAMSQQDFIGTWTGQLTTFKNNKLTKEHGNILIFPEEGGTLLGGIIYLSETRAFREFQFQNGTLYFRVFNTDPTSPTCQNWNLSGYASFLDETTLDIRISGNECGSIGSEYVDWSGSMNRSSAVKDSLPCFTFAKTSNNWTYEVYKDNGDSCQVQKLLAQKTGDYQFTGESTHSCGWANQNIPVKWNVSPAEFFIKEDATISSLPITIPIYAKQGVVYPSYFNSDTVTLTLLYSNQTVNTAIGNFNCNQYRFTETITDTTGQRLNRMTYLWVEYHYGIIKHLVIDPVYKTDIKLQLLKAKNFQ